MDHSLFPPPPPRNNAYTKITYYNANYIKRNDTGREVNDNTDIFYHDGKDYIKLGPISKIIKKGHSDKMMFDGVTHDMRNYQDDLYVKSGGYRKRKTFRKISKRIRKRKTKTKKNYKIKKY